MLLGVFLRYWIGLVHSDGDSGGATQQLVDCSG